MAYVTVDELKARFGADEIELLLDRDANGLPDNGTADAAIADASAELDTMLGGRYPIPLPATQWLKSAVADLARARLYDEKAPDAVMERRKEVIARAREIGRGQGVLLGDDGTPVPERTSSVTGGGITVSAPKRVFDDQGLSGYV